MALSILLLLLTGLSVVGTAPPFVRIYHLISTPATWADAQSYCRTNYNNLASAQTPQEWAGLATKVGAASPPVWLGLTTDVDQWHWSYGTVPLLATAYNQWSNFNTMTEKCGVIYEDGHWDDYICDDVNPIICYDASQTGAARFVGKATPMVTWAQAQAYCRTYYTDMATVTDAEDNNLAMLIAQQQTWSWLGLYKGGVWTWPDGSNTTSLPWQPNSPDNAVPPENCATYQAGLLSDVQCGGTNYFVCDSLVLPRKLQRVKLHVSSNGSTIDPASEEAILNLVIAKLQEHGVSENVTVRWKPLPAASGKI